MSAFRRAHSKVASKRREDHFVDGEVNSKILGGEGVLGALVEVIEPIEIEHIGLADYELVAELFIQVVIDLMFGERELGRLERAVEKVLLLLLDEAANLVDRVTLESVVFVELEVVELGKGSLGLCS